MTWNAGFSRHDSDALSRNPPGFPTQDRGTVHIEELRQRFEALASLRPVVSDGVLFCAHGPECCDKSNDMSRAKVALIAADNLSKKSYSLHMAQLSKIHEGKETRRTHFIKEWAEKRGLKQADVAKELDVERSTVQRWFSGALPSKADHLERLTALFSLEEPSGLFRHPDDDWIYRLLSGRDEAEKNRVRQIIDAAVPRVKAS